MLLKETEQDMSISFFIYIINIEMPHYFKLKEEKVFNLFSSDATKILNDAGRVVSFIFRIPPDFCNFSKNAELFVSNFSYENDSINDDNAGFVIRMLEVNNTHVYDSQRGAGAVIYHTKLNINNKSDIRPTFKIYNAINTITLNISNVIVDRDAGVSVDDMFIITLIVRDYDEVPVDPKNMPLIEDYHKYKQFNIKY